jgi:hypothetical protein
VPGYGWLIDKQSRKLLRTIIKLHVSVLLDIISLVYNNQNKGVNLRIHYFVTSNVTRSFYNVSIAEYLHSSLICKSCVSYLIFLKYHQFRPNFLSNILKTKRLCQFLSFIESYVVLSCQMCVKCVAHKQWWRKACVCAPGPTFLKHHWNST